MWGLVIFIAFNSLLQVLANDSGSFRKLPYVSTEYGIVRGHLVQGDDFSYMAFLGIPYAQPPLGRNRFKAPLPAVPWDGVLEANKTVKCPQSGTGSEDCLVINVFTPDPRDKKSKLRLPVLVFIHGGAFFMGTAPNEGMEYLLEKDVIVVTFNYRIGVLGFLCLGTEEAPGNAGMKDQVAALQWVQKNIANFGGHPKQVTIFGTSAGGASVDLQVLSKMSNGLFRAAIAESGTATSMWPIDNNPIGTATKLAETLNFVPRNVNDLTEFYIDKSAEELSAANVKYHYSLTDGTVGFAPCIEYNSQPDTPRFLSESPHDIIQKGDYDKVPIMLVFATLEGIFLRSSHYHQWNYKQRMNENFEYFLPADLVFESAEERRSVAQEIKAFYFGNKTIDDDMIIEYLEYFGDSIILHGILNAAEFYSRRMPVYLMEFSYKGSRREYEALVDHIDLAGHSAMASYTFVATPITELDDLLNIQRVAEIITNFVKLSNPTPHPTTLVPLMWPRVEYPEMTYLHYDENLQIAEKPHWMRKVFWDSVYKLYNGSSPIEENAQD